MSKAGESKLTPHQSEDPCSPNSAVKKSIALFVKTLQSYTIEYRVTKIVLLRY